MARTVGETHIPEATFLDADGTPYNPGNVFIRILSPSGQLTSPPYTNVDVGTFLFPFILTARGVWRGWIHGEGPGAAIVIEPFSVCAVGGL